MLARTIVLALFAGAYVVDASILEDLHHVPESACEEVLNWDQGPAATIKGWFAWGELERHLKLRCHESRFVSSKAVVLNSSWPSMCLMPSGTPAHHHH